MIKRPLCWVLGAYMAGMCLAWYKISLGSIIILMLLLYLIIYFLMFRAKKEFINHLDRFLWGLPLLLLLGFFAMGGQLEEPELDQAFGAKAQGELSGTVTMIIEKKLGRALYVTDNTVYLSKEEPYQCENVIVYCSDHQNYLIGNQITVYGEIQKFSEATNPGQFNEKLYYQIENIDYKVAADKIIITNHEYSKFNKALYGIKQRLIKVYNTILSEKESGTLIAMLLGEKYLLDEEIKRLYQENGIAHILAISGLHVSLIGVFLYQLLKKLRLPLIPAKLLTILFLYGYGVLTNFSVSTKRAVVMMVVMLLSGIFGKTYDMLSATVLSAFLILLKNPMQIFSVGFLFSFGAVLGIAVIYPNLQILFSSKNSLLSSLFVSISAQAMTMPVLLSFFYQLPIYSTIVNLLVLPCVAVLVLTALFAGIAGVISIPLGVFCIGGANYILKFYEGICTLGSNLPGNLITVGKPDWSENLLCIILVLLFVWGVKHYKKKIFILLLIMVFILPILPHKNNGLEITMLDVGQGECIFMKSATGTTYLVDGGSADVMQVGVYRIQPFLLSKGIGRIDYAIVSHADSDHVSGLKELLVGKRIVIKKLVLPDITAKDDSYVELEEIAKEQGIPILYIKEGDMLQEGELRMICLHPALGYLPSSSNDYSTVLSVTYREFDMLLTGDLEKKGEDLLVRQFQTLNSKGSMDSLNPMDSLKPMNSLPSVTLPVTDYDVLKVAHHGSQTSTSEALLQIIQPEISLISCGKDNIYGHPHKALLERLNQVESNVKITFESGAITIKTDGNTLKLFDYCSP